MTLTPCAMCSQFIHAVEIPVEWASDKLPEEEAYITLKTCVNIQCSRYTLLVLPLNQ